MNNLKIALTGGGTAGHIWPVLDVAEEISKKIKGNDFIYLGSKEGLEAKLVPATNIKFFQVSSGKLRRYWSWQNLIDPVKIMMGFLQARKILKKERPKVLFAKGGYVTVPVVLAARSLKIPIVCHESDSVLGLANRILYRIVQKIMVSFPAHYYSQKYQKKLFYSGLPVRRNFFRAQKFKGYQVFGLSDRLKTLLVTGGSQGAHFINQMILRICPEILKDFQIIHLTGILDFEQAKNVRANLPEDQKDHYKIYDFLSEEMPEAMAMADLIVSRAGANTLAEIAILAKPSILIPLPLAAANHQNLNAQIFGENKAAVVLDQQKITPEKLLKTILDLLNHQVLLEQLGENAQKFSKPGAAKIIAEHILSLVL